MRTTRVASTSLSVPQIFCWTKMGTEAGQDLRSILRRKELERQSGGGMFSWGIGNSIGSALARARSLAGDLHALFTPMKSAPKKSDVAPTDIVVWLAYHGDKGQVTPLPLHMLITSRQRSASGAEKRFHYALLCRRQESLVDDPDGTSIDPRLARNLASEHPVGSSQVTAVVKYANGRRRSLSGGVYNVQFRAKVVDQGVIRLAMPVKVAGDLMPLYENLVAASSEREWMSTITKLKSLAAAHVERPPWQGSLFSTDPTPLRKSGVFHELCE